MDTPVARPQKPLARPTLGDAPLRTAVWLAFGLVVAALLVVRLADVLLMAFGSVLTAVLLHALAAPLQKLMRLSPRAALVLAVAVVTVFAAGVVWVFGSQAAAQVAALSRLLPQAWAGLQARLAGSPVGATILHEVAGLRIDGGWLLNLGPRLAGEVAGMAAGGVIVAFAGLYLAFNPQSYFNGALSLVSPRRRRQVADAARAVHLSLRQWLVGQLLSMVIVGLTTGLGLWAAGAPSPAALGAIAGLGQFVPVVGPMAATVPGLLAALAVGPQTFGWALVVYVAASQLEANLITPLMLRQMAQLPMAVTLFAVLAMGVLLGPLGVLFATPLAVVVYVLVKVLYVAPLSATPSAQVAAARD